MHEDIKDFRNEILRNFDKLNDKLDAQDQKHTSILFEHTKLLAEARAKIDQNAADIGFAHHKLRNMPKVTLTVLSIIVALIAIVSFSTKETKSKQSQGKIIIKDNENVTENR